MPEPLRVLITGAGSATAVGVLKGLRMAGGVHALMGDMNPDCAGAHLGDGFVLLPAGKAPDFGTRMLELCERERVGLVIPIIDYEFAGWSRLVPELARRGTRVAISSEPALGRCQQKDRTDAYFRSLGVPCVTTWRAGEVTDPASLPYPVYLKPRCGRASLDNYRADDADDYRVFVKRVPDAIVQPFARGEEVTIDTLSDFDGRFLAALPRVRVEIKSGQAYRSRTFRDAALEATARRVVEGLPIVGAANLQCFLTDDGPLFFEINARFGAGTVLSMHAGMNGPAALAALAAGQPPPPLEGRAGVRMFRYWQEVFV
ncbi:MAG: ATP-grasp domain-containing protein [Gemmataceae bacterium]